jgi:hypothetical protein
MNAKLKDHIISACITFVITFASTLTIDNATTNTMRVILTVDFFFHTTNTGVGDANELIGEFITENGVSTGAIGGAPAPTLGGLITQENLRENYGVGHWDEAFSFTDIL